MLTKGAMGNLVNRYRAVLKKCHIMNTFGSLAVAAMLVMGSAGMASAADDIIMTGTLQKVTVDADGNKIIVEVETKTGTIYAKVRRLRVGRVDLYLLDTDLEANSQEDRELTSRLYGGNKRTRIRQEIVCGVGGVKALRALGISPGVYHLNEGHNSFATLEAVRQKMEDCGMTFEAAVADGAQGKGIPSVKIGGEGGLFAGCLRVKIKEGKVVFSLLARKNAVGGGEGRI